eukprot:CAMPEP_0170524284 /NCGR_PEP_ID=MMETSP0209-20121228/9713_1 /TAXON_ID=665100 ORGANISM="Litonotus pictus, Strain P1" /NCGR_SAMPLE_ID=MMETSP0209 /ASSEMBLY_ACC=CAM_ASM_000301 /LENGTH=1055 /DNA_ID=CAMNT_0010812863 /DNA_START=81 /DNA_END=3245 /DNA_ORIENTATION=+
MKDLYQSLANDKFERMKQIYSHVKIFKGGIANFYDRIPEGERIKEIYIKGNINFRKINSLDESRSSLFDDNSLYSSENDSDSFESQESVEGNYPTASFHFEDIRRDKSKASVVQPLTSQKKISIKKLNKQISTSSNEKKTYNLVSNNLSQKVNTLGEAESQSKHRKNSVISLIKMKKHSIIVPSQAKKSQEEKFKEIKDLQLQVKDKVQVSSQYILGQNLEGISPSETRELIFSLINYGQGIKGKLIYKDSIQDLEVFNSQIKTTNELRSKTSNVKGHNLALSLCQIQETILLRENFLLNEESAVIENNSIFNAKDKMLEKDRLGNSKNREHKNETPQSLKILIIITLLLLFSIIGFTIIEYSLMLDNFNSIGKSFYLLKDSLNSCNYIQTASLILTDLILLNHGIENLGDISKEVYIDNSLTYLKQIEQALRNIEKNFTTVDVNISEELKDIFSGKTTPISLFTMDPSFNETSKIEQVFKERQTSQSSSNSSQAVKMNISAYFLKNDSPVGSGITGYSTYLYTYLQALKLHRSFLLYLFPEFSLKKFVDHNKYIFQFLHNSNHDFFKKTYQISRLFSESIEEDLSTKKSDIISFYIVSLVIYTITVLTITYMLSKVERERQRILHSFYKLPLYYVKWLSELCGRFIIKIQRNKITEEGSEVDEEDISNMDIDEIEHNYGQEFKTRKKPAYSVILEINSYTSKSPFFYLIFFIAYFTSVFALSWTAIERLDLLKNLLMNVSDLDTNSTLAYNYVRERVLNPNLLLIDNSEIHSAVFDSTTQPYGTDPYYYLDRNILEHLNKTTNIINDVSTKFLVDSDMLSQKDKEEINRVLYKSFCKNIITDARLKADLNINLRGCFENSNKRTFTVSEYGLQVIFRDFYDKVIKYHKHVIGIYWSRYPVPQAEEVNRRRELDHTEEIIPSPMNLELLQLLDDPEERTISSISNHYIHYNNHYPFPEWFSIITSAKKYTYNTLYRSDFLEGNTILKDYIRPAVQIIQDTVLSSSIAALEDLKRIKKVLFSVVIVLSILFYLAFAFHQNKLKEDIQRTQLMLNVF